jgi:hypothetical protein
MISALLVVMMQAGGTYTHLPKLTLFPTPVAAPAIAKIVKQDAAQGLCSVHMPRMAVPKDVEFYMGTLKPQSAGMPTAVVPAPECKVPESR